VEISLEDYLRENPDKNEGNFAELKFLSDTDFLELDRADYRLTRKNVPIHGLDETDACAVESLEEEVIELPHQLAEKHHRRELAKRALDKLTEIQRRRYLLHHVNGLSTWQIAEKEGANQKSIHESLQAAEKKIKKFLSKR